MCNCNGDGKCKCKKVALVLVAALILFLAGIGLSQSVMKLHRPAPRGFMCKACVCAVEGNQDCRCEKCKTPKMGKHFKKELRKDHKPAPKA